MTRKTFLIAMFGVMVQYYDHHLFGFLAAKISVYFLPDSDPIIQLLNTYFIMAIAVAAKPIGALTLGRIGDLYGRSTTLTISLLGTAVASLVVSLTPGYSHIGILSAVILLVTRMCTSAFASSGTDGVRLFIYERIGKNKQCLGNGLVTSSTLLGSFIASMSAWFFTLDMMPPYAWRASFLLGSIMGVGMVLVRRHFRAQDDDSTVNEPGYDAFKNVPIWVLIKENWELFVTCLFVAGAIGSTNQFYIIFFGTYNFNVLGVIEQSTMQFYTSIAIVLYMIFAIVGGLAADYFGRKAINSLAFFALLILTIATILSLSHGKTDYSLFFASNIALPFLNVTALAFLKQSIPIVIRYRIFSLAHAVGSICISTPTAFISTYMYHKTGLVWLPMVYFLVSISIIVVGVNILCRRYRANKY
ncbi:MAG: MFS transporter [Pseudomonadota bacterium]